MISVLGDHVLVAVRKAPSEIVSDGGIVLVKDPEAAKAPTQGIVMALGQKSDSVSLDDVKAMMNDMAFEADVVSGYNEPGRHRIADLSELLSNLTLLSPAPFDVQVGDCVLFPLQAGDQVSADGVDYVILREVDLIGIVEPLVEKGEAA